MKKLLLGTIIFVLAVVVPAPAMARVDISVGISLPPLITFHAAPEVVPMPDADDVYFVPDIDVDVFFWDGWWWRPWQGRWYHSRYYDRGWAYYSRVPAFYFDIHPGWRVFYRDRIWHGHPWHYERIPHGRLERNWRSWHGSQYWERKRTWGVQRYQPRPHHERQELRRQREEQYHGGPEVQRHLQPGQPHSPRPEHAPPKGHGPDGGPRR